MRLPAVFAQALLLQSKYFPKSPSTLFLIEIDAVRVAPDAALLIAFQLASRPAKPQLFCPRCPLDPPAVHAATCMASQSTNATATGQDPASHGATTSSQTTATTQPPQPFLYSIFSATPFQQLFGGNSKEAPTPSTTTAKANRLDDPAPDLWQRAKSLFDLPSLLASSSALLPTKKPSNADLPTVGLRSSSSLTDIFQYYSPSGSIRNSPNASPAISRSSSRATLLHSSHGEDDTQAESTLLLQSLTVDTLHELAASLLPTTAPPSSRMITESAFGSFLPEPRTKGDPTVLVQNVKHVFSSPVGMSSSFLATDSASSEPAPLLGVDMDGARRAYDMLLVRLKHIPEVRDALVSATEILLARLEVTAPTWKLSRPGGASTQQAITAISKKLRQIILIMVNPLLVDRAHSDVILRRFCVVVASLKRDVKGYLARKLSEYFCLHRSELRLLVQTVKKYLCERYYPNNKSDDGVVAAVRALSLLYNVNELSAKIIKKQMQSDEEVVQSSSSSIVPYSDFYCTIDAKDCRSISDRFHFKEEYLRWRRLNANPASLRTEFSLLNYPFLFDPIAKSRVLRVESMSSMTSGFEMAFINNAFVTQAQRLLTGLETMESQSPKRPENSVPVASSSSTASDQQQHSPSDVVAEIVPVPSSHSETTTTRREPEPRRSGIRTPLTSASIEAAFQGATNPYFVLEVRREHLIEDAIDQITVKRKDLHKPLKIKFVGSGEEGLDQGGVQKEFFQIIIQQLLDPAYGLFQYDKETRLYWINGFSMEPTKFFDLFGVVLGLALYNGVMVDINLPDVFYKKLLLDGDSRSMYRGDDSVALDDIEQLYPSLHRGLKMLLGWDEEADGGSVEDIFCRNFEISYEVYGQVKTFPLVDGGGDMPVTESNRREYCDRYVEHLLSVSVTKQLAAIRKGFWRVMSGDGMISSSSSSPNSKRQAALGSSSCVAVRLLRPEELRLMLSGLSTSSSAERQALYSSEAFEALKEVCGYEEFSADSLCIQWFWDLVLKEFSHEQRRKLLWFVTASDRIPLGGLREVGFVIQKNGSDGTRLPTAYTCFSRLLLPDYVSRDLLKTNLSRAIEESKGFGLM